MRCQCCHLDADFAATVAGMPDGLSGKRLAIHIVDLARGAILRRASEGWWQALEGVRDGLVPERMPGKVEVRAAIPKARPWVKE